MLKIKTKALVYKKYMQDYHFSKIHWRGNKFAVLKHLYHEFLQLCSLCNKKKKDLLVFVK